MKIIATEGDEGREARLAEERFLFATQRAMQRALNEKGVRYKDLARRLGVSEARVSHIFGDDASNLTMKTVARVFYCLGEKPLILSVAEYDRRFAEATGGAQPTGSTWTMSGVPTDFWIEPSAATVENSELPKTTGKVTTPHKWTIAEDAAERRKRAA
jgi:transcriptional regulator with XRE-family HTH domain